MNWNAIAQSVRKMPVAKWFKPIWKAGLRIAVQQCGDWLQIAVNVEIANNLDKAGTGVVGLIEKWKDKTDALILAYAPAAFQTQAVAACDAAAASLEGRLGEAIAAGSAGAVKDAVDRAFDKFQADLIAKIAAL